MNRQMDKWAASGEEQTEENKKNKRKTLPKMHITL